MALQKNFFAWAVLTYNLFRLNLAVNKAINTQEIRAVIQAFRKITGHFNHSAKKKQQLAVAQTGSS